MDDLFLALQATDKNSVKDCGSAASHRANIKTHIRPQSDTVILKLSNKIGQLRQDR